MLLDLSDRTIWENCPKGNNPWDKYMGLNNPIIHENVSNGEQFIRFDCFEATDGSYRTSGFQTIQPLSEGYIEVKARFHGGTSSWPAIWLFNGRNNKYYEIDICEHFNNSKKVKTGLFMYKHMHSWLKRLFRPKTYTKIDKEGWNTYACEWNETFIKIYINGHLILTYKNNGDWKTYPQTEEDRKFTLILSMQYDYKGKAKPKELPLWMDVSYVYYEPKNK